MKRRVRENIAASVGPGWRSQGANVGTDAVVKRNPADVAREWATALGRPPSLKEKGAWEKHAEREGLDPEEIDRGWAFLSQHASKEESNALATLRKVFGESGQWGGEWMPNQALLQLQTDPFQPDKTGKVRRKNFEKPKTEATGFVGVPKMHQAPQVGNAKGQAQLANETPPSFPFATRTAELVWNAAQELVRLEPLDDAAEILRKAMESAGVTINELTPEDIQLLKMAVYQLQNGPPISNIRNTAVPGRRGVV